jgi:hypothetical protein
VGPSLPLPTLPPALLLLLLPPKAPLLVHGHPSMPLLATRVMPGA